MSAPESGIRLQKKFVPWSECVPPFLTSALSQHYYMTAWSVHTTVTKIAFAERHLTIDFRTVNELLPNVVRSTPANMRGCIISFLLIKEPLVESVFTLMHPILAVPLLPNGPLKRTYSSLTGNGTNCQLLFFHIVLISAKCGGWFFGRKHAL